MEFHYLAATKEFTVACSCGLSLPGTLSELEGSYVKSQNIRRNLEEVNPG